MKEIVPDSIRKDIGLNSRDSQNQFFRLISPVSHCFLSHLLGASSGKRDVKNIHMNYKVDAVPFFAVCLFTLFFKYFLFSGLFLEDCMKYKYSFILDLLF